MNKYLLYSTLIGLVMSIFLVSYVGLAITKQVVLIPENSLQNFEEDSSKIKLEGLNKDLLNNNLEDIALGEHEKQEKQEEQEKPKEEQQGQIQENAQESNNDSQGDLASANRIHSYYEAKIKLSEVDGEYKNLMDAALKRYEEIDKITTQAFDAQAKMVEKQQQI